MRCRTGLALSHWLAFVVEVCVFRGTAHIYDLIYEASGKDYAAEAREVDTQIRDRTRRRARCWMSLAAPAAICVTSGISTR